MLKLQLGFDMSQLGAIEQVAVQLALFEMQYQQVPNRCCYIEQKTLVINKCPTGVAEDIGNQQVPNKCCYIEQKTLVQRSPHFSSVVGCTGEGHITMSSGGPVSWLSLLDRTHPSWCHQAVYLGTLNLTKTWTVQTI